MIVSDFQGMNVFFKNTCVLPEHGVMPVILACGRRRQEDKTASAFGKYE